MTNKWVEKAICRGLNTDIFFDERRSPNERMAKNICHKCPVATECLHYAQTNYINFGIWGGKTPRERMVIRRTRRSRVLVGDYNANAPDDELPRWQSLALCRGMNPALFIPVSDNDIVSNTLAVQVCQKCPVINECLDYAMPNEKFGVWGGKTAVQRKKIIWRQQHAYTMRHQGTSMP